MNKLSINVICISYRKTKIAKSIIRSCINFSSKLDGVAFTFAYGGDDEEYFNEIAKEYENNKNNEFFKIHEPSIEKRLDFSLSIEREWAIFISDDDPFSINYLESLAEASLSADRDVSIISASCYPGITSQRIFNRGIQPIIDGQIENRYHQLIKNNELG